jgi:hypothetical protein
VAGAWAKDATAALESKAVAIRVLMFNMVINSLVNRRSQQLRPSRASPIFIGLVFTTKGLPLG